jgi:uncharacterized repeat protein (TIGR03803 family)
LWGASGQARAASFQLIHTFQGAPDGQGPMSGVVADSQGRLYGTTFSGGVAFAGTIYRLTPPEAGQSLWTEDILHDVVLAEGSNPRAPVTLGADGLIYASTSQGGAYGGGTIFSIRNEVNSPSTLLHSFDPQLNGGELATSLVFGAGGLLYGATPIIGLYNQTQFGTDFSLSPLGDKVEYHVIHAFGQPGDGYSPVGLTPLPAGYPEGFVGATHSTMGVSNGSGTVYLLPTTAKGRGREKVIAAFGPGPFAPNSPVSPPIVGQGSISNAFYGCLSGGGAFGQGVIYKLTRSGDSYSTTIIYNFGQHPGDAQVGEYGQCWIVQANSEGRIYGITDAGGANQGGGAFFVLDPPKRKDGAWSEAVLYNFDPATGSIPIGAPVKVGEKYYGALEGTPNLLGGVYELTP